MKRLLLTSFLTAVIGASAFASTSASSTCTSCATQAFEKFDSDIKKSKLVIAEETYLESKTHPLLKNCGMDTLFDIAVKTKQYISKKYPKFNYKILALGQSPAWLVEMMKLIDEEQGQQDTRYDFIPFSSAFFTYNPVTKQFTRYVSPTSESLQSYKERLKKSGLFQIKKDELLFILEFPQDGPGLVSFYEVARHDLPQDFSFLISKPKLALPSSQILDFIDQTTIKELIYPLSRLDDFDDRLVMHYPYTKWQHTDPFTFQLSASALLLKKIMKTYVKCRLNHQNQNN